MAHRFNADRMITTSLAPTFIVAANFIILGHIIRRVGPQYSRIPPKMCEWFTKMHWISMP
jgi:RTA1 like protein